MSKMVSLTDVQRNIKQAQAALDCAIVFLEEVDNTDEDLVKGLRSQIQKICMSLDESSLKATLRIAKINTVIGRRSQRQVAVAARKAKLAKAIEATQDRLEKLQAEARK